MELKTDVAFLNKIQKQIKRGEYDEYLTIPFMSKALLYSTIKAEYEARHAESGVLLLTAAEIKYAIETTKITGAEVFKLFVDSGILEKSVDGYQMSKKGKLALRTLNYV